MFHLFLYCRTIFNGKSGNVSEYKINNVPVKLYPWEETNKFDEKPFRIMPKSIYIPSKFYDASIEI